MLGEGFTSPFDRWGHWDPKEGREGTRILSLQCLGLSLPPYPELCGHLIKQDTDATALEPNVGTSSLG